LIAATNRSSLRAAEKGRYSVAARLALLEWKASRGSRDGPRRASGFARVPPRSFKAAAAASPILEVQGGLLHFPLRMTQVMAMNDGALTWAHAQHMLHHSGRAGPVLAAVFDDRPRYMRMQPLTSTPGTAGAMLDFVREQKGKEAFIVLPDVDPIAAPFLEAGFHDSDWGRHIVIMEKRLRRPGAPTSGGRARAAPRKQRR